MADRAALRTYAREQVLLDTSDVADTILDAYLDRAVQIVATRFQWPWLEASSTVDSVIGQHNYALPSGHSYTFALIEDDTKDRLRKLSPVQAWTRYGDDPPSGKARAFYFYEGELWLVETPTAVLTYNWFYRKAPTLMAANDDVPEWDVNHHYFLAEYVISQLWLREEDRQLADGANQRFETGIAELAQFYLHRASDAPMVWGESADMSIGWNRGNMPWLDGV